MKYVFFAGILALGGSAFAQDVRFDYNRSTNFGAFKTYQWVDYRQVGVGD